MSGEGDAPRLGVVEALEQGEDRGLAGARGPDDRGLAASGHLEVDAVEDEGTVRAIAEAHGLEAHERVVLAVAVAVAGEVDR